MELKDKQVMSKLLEREISVKGYDLVDEYGETLQIITYRSLRNIIDNEMPERKVKVLVEPHKISLEHSVYQCTISDDKGHSGYAVGESTRNTLPTTIGSENPSTMAWLRAFAIAARMYLQLPDNVFCTCENIRGEMYCAGNEVLNAAPCNSAPVEKVNALAKGSQPSERAIAGQETRVTAPIKHTDRPLCPPENTASDSDLPGDMIVTVSPYKNRNLTVAQIYATNPKFVKWLAKSYTPCAETQSQADAARAYLETMEA